jgi:hypothetical protein
MGTSKRASNQQNFNNMVGYIDRAKFRQRPKIYFDLISLPELGKMMFLITLQPGLLHESSPISHAISLKISGDGGGGGGAGFFEFEPF